MMKSERQYMRLSTTRGVENNSLSEWWVEMIEDSNSSIAKLYRTDKWVRDFMISCFDIYGVPKFFDNCASVDDEYYYGFASMMVVIAMKNMQDEWTQLKEEGVDPRESAYLFSEYYFAKNGEHLIPSFSHGAATDLDDEYPDDV